MYTRSYFQDDVEINVPENYDGNAFREKEKSDATCEEVNSDVSCYARERDCDRHQETKSDTGVGVLSAFFQKLPFSNLFERFNFSKFERLDFGTEEILIIGLSLFLLLSGSKDIECAIMLFLLLLIK